MKTRREFLKSMLSGAAVITTAVSIPGVLIAGSKKGAAIERPTVIGEWRPIHTSGYAQVVDDFIGPVNEPALVHEPKGAYGVIARNRQKPETFTVSGMDGHGCETVIRPIEGVGAIGHGLVSGPETFSLSGLAGESKQYNGKHYISGVATNSFKI